MSDATRGIARRPAPNWAVWFLVLSIPTALLAVFVSVVAAGVVFPLFDLTPAVVLVVACVSRRWEGAWTRGFAAASAVAAVMVVEWVAWDVWFLRGLFAGSSYGFERVVSELVNSLSSVYLVEVGVVLALFFAAVVITTVRIKRLVSHDRVPATVPGLPSPADHA